MLMLLQTVVDQQATIGSLSARLEQMEASQRDLEARCNAQTAVATLVADLEGKFAALEKRTTQSLSKVQSSTAAAEKKADAAGSEAKRHSDSAVASVRSDIAALRSQVDGVKASMVGLEKKLSAESGKGRR